MYITSGGGLVYAGLAIYDVMQYISSPVRTVCIGHAESMAAILLASGEPGHRIALPNGRIMVHQPTLGVSRASSTDTRQRVRVGANRPPPRSLVRPSASVLKTLPRYNWYAAAAITATLISRY